MTPVASETFDGDLPTMSMIRKSFVFFDYVLDCNQEGLLIYWFCDSLLVSPFYFLY